MSVITGLITLIWALNATMCRADKQGIFRKFLLDIEEKDTQNSQLNVQLTLSTNINIQLQNTITIMEQQIQV